MVDVVQLVRTSDCDSEGRGFESHHSPQKQKPLQEAFVFISLAEVSPRGTSCV
jgi:hypothetical protein